MKYYSLVIFLLCSVFVYAQNFVVTGKVTDFHDKTGLNQAEINIGEAKTRTNRKGEFSLKVPQGSYTIKVSHPSCDPYIELLVVDKNLLLDIALEHHANEIQEVLIHNVQKKKGSMIIQTIDANEIAKKSTENLGNILAGISGVSSLKTGNNISKPMIHGLYGSRVSIINSGVKMAEQEWGVEHSPNIDVNAFEHIDVIKGASALKYGNDGVSGVVVLEPAIIPKKDTLFGKVGLSGITNGRGGALNADLTKTWKNQWFVTTSGSYKKLGDQYTPQGTMQNTGAEVRSFNFSTGKRSFLNGFDISYSGIKQEFGIFKGAHLGSPEDYYHAINSGGNLYFGDFGYRIDAPKQDVEHHIIKAQAYQRFANFGKVTLQYSLQYNRRKEFDIRKGENEGLASMDLRLITNTLQLIHLLERDHWKLESGLVGSFQDNYPNPDTKARRLIPDYFRYDAGAFSIFQYHLNDRWNLEAGARYDFSRYDAYKYYDEGTWEDKYGYMFPEFVISDHHSRVLTRPILDYHNFSANIGVHFQPTESLRFKLNASKVSRTPNPAELFADGLHHSASVIEEGYLGLKKEDIYQVNFNINAKANILNGLQLEVNPYFLTSKSFINQVPVGIQNTNRGVFPIWMFQQIEARMYGIDVDAQLAINNQLKWKGQFSGLRGEDLTNNEDLILMMPANFKNSLEFSLPKNAFYVRVENENVFKQNHFPNRNLMVDFIENGELVSKEIDYSSTPSAYSLFNVSVGLDVIKNFNINLRMNNVFNKNYRDYLNRMRYFAPELGRNFIVTLQYKF